MTDDRSRLVRALAALAVAAALTTLAVGCGTASTSGLRTPASSDAAAPTDAASGSIDEPVEEDSAVPDLPTLAPVPDDVKASAGCDKAYRVWMDWWQASVDVVDPNDPNAAASALPSGDPDKIERAVFEKCSLIDIAAANRDHPITLDPDEGPVPFIDDDVIAFVAGMCDDDSDIIGDTALCQALPSPTP